MLLGFFSTMISTSLAMNYANSAITFIQFARQFRHGFWPFWPSTKHSVMYIKRFDFIRKPFFQKLVVLSIIVIHLLIYIDIPIELTVKIATYNDNQSIRFCDLSNLGDNSILTIVFLVEAVILPFLVMLITTVLISKTLVLSRKILAIQRLNARQIRDKKFAATSELINVLYVHNHSFHV